MNQEQAKKYLPIITALAEGKKIQYKDPYLLSDWADVDQPSFIPGYEYRVKPEPKVIYIPVHRSGYATAAWETKRAALEQIKCFGCPNEWVVDKFVQEL